MPAARGLSPPARLQQTVNAFNGGQMTVARHFCFTEEQNKQHLSALLQARKRQALNYVGLVVDAGELTGFVLRHDHANQPGFRADKKLRAV